MPIPEGVRGRIINNDTMKKLLYFMLAALCMTACSGNTPTQSTTKGDYVDLGLPSGTKWKSANEANGEFTRYSYDQAIFTFGDHLPTKEQFEELRSTCNWTWTGSGYKVVGPSGKSITLPAAGCRYCDGSVNGVGTYGSYWSSSPYGSEIALSLYFDSGEVSMSYNHRCNDQSVRLVR